MIHDRIELTDYSFTNPHPRHKQVAEIIKKIDNQNYEVRWPDGEVEILNTFTHSLRFIKSEKAQTEAAEKAQVEAAAKAEKAEAEARILDSRANAWNLEFKKFGNGRCARAVPNEEFWADWKRNRTEIKNIGFWVEKGVKYMVYARVNFQVDILDVDLEKTIRVDWNHKSTETEPETTRDDLENGLFNTGAANNLRAETPDEYERRRNFEEDGYGDRY